MKAVLYARVSKEEAGLQNPQNQLKPLRKLAEAMGFTISKEYIDCASGGNPNRPSFRLMMEAVKRHEFDIILIWALDRFSREGILNTLSYLATLRKNNVALKSLQESWLDTRDEGMGHLLIAIFAWVAEQERKRISERTKAGLKGKKNVGKRGPDKKQRRRSGYNLRWSKKREAQKNDPFL